MNKFTLSTVYLATMIVVLLVHAGTVLGQPVFIQNMNGPLRSVRDAMALSD